MEKKDDDEISIDFSKIGSFFKKKKEEPQAEADVKIQEIEQKPHHDVQESKKPHDQDDKAAKNDEITIDFSKLKNIFKRSETNQKDDDTISVDFSKIKNMFKKSEKEKKEDDDTVSIDTTKIKEFLVKYSVLLILLIPIFLSIFVRIQPAYLPITDQWAENAVSNAIKSQIQGQIAQQYPNLPEQNRNSLVENEYQRLLGEQKDQIEQQIKATSDSFKSRLQDDVGTTYLIGIDPFFWARHARNIIERGHPGDEIRDGKAWDTHMLAPVGRPVPFDMLHSYFIAYLYKFVDFFSTDPSLMKVTFYTPVILCALAVIPAFFIGRSLAGNLAGLVAGIIIGIHPSFLSRTIGGFADTDPYNILFPLFITWMVIEAFEAKNLKWAAIYAAIGGLIVGVFSYSWSGWSYVFDFILAATIFSLIYYVWTHRNEFKSGLSSVLQNKTIEKHLVFLAAFFIVSAISSSVIVSFDHFSAFVMDPIEFSKLKEVGVDRIWPNVYTTVAEQNPASLSSVISQVSLGKYYFLIIALVGLMFLFQDRGPKNWWFILGSAVWYTMLFVMKIQTLKTFIILMLIPIAVRILYAIWDNDKNINIKYPVLFALWMAATIYASTKGIRFVMLILPAYAIGLGVTLNKLQEYASSLLSKSLHVHKLIAQAATIVLVLFIAGTIPIPWTPFCIGMTCESSINVAMNQVTDFDDSWRVSLEKIRDNSKPNAIITSWWDFGHWFKYWADRPVTFDGTTQNTAQAHWVGRALLTDNEEEVVAILRMLDCSERASFFLIAKKTKDQTEAVEINKEIIVLSAAKAKTALLDRGFTEEEAAMIVEMTHCIPPEGFFITSEDMVGKSGVWAHFGSWDFNRALMYLTLKKEEYKDDRQKSIAFLQNRFNFSEQEAEKWNNEVESVTTSEEANSWIAPWPGYAGSVGCGSPDTDNIVTCSNGFIINLTAKDIYAKTPQGILYPKKAAFPEQNNVIIKEYDESLFVISNNRYLGLAVIDRGGSYDLIQMDSDLVGSMFTRLFYYDGKGISRFTMFSDETTIFGSRVIVWKVNWDLGNTTAPKT